MSTIKVTLTDGDGNVIEEGSVRAVELYAERMWLIQSVMDEASQLIPVLPDGLEDTVRTLHQQLGRKLDTVRTLVTRVRDDGASKGMDFALREAKHRGELL